MTKTANDEAIIDRVEEIAPDALQAYRQAQLDMTVSFSEEMPGSAVRRGRVDTLTRSMHRLFNALPDDLREPKQIERLMFLVSRDVQEQAEQMGLTNQSWISAADADGNIITSGAAGRSNSQYKRC